MQIITDGYYDNFGASLRVWAMALCHILQQGRDLGMNTETPDFIAGILERAQKAGFGEKYVMAAAEVLRA